MVLLSSLELLDPSSSLTSGIIGDVGLESGCSGLRPVPRTPDTPDTLLRMDGSQDGEGEERLKEFERRFGDG